MRACIAVFILALFPASTGAETITVSAAVSLRETITQIARQYQARTCDRVDINFGASGMLAAQIEQGAPVDAFVSAANQQIEELIQSGRADRASRRIVVTNALVLVVPARAANPPRDFLELTSGKVKKIAIGQPRSVPAGLYAMQVLTSLKLTDAVRDRLVYAANVRQVLDYVQRDEVDAGVVYRTDAIEAGDAVKVTATAEASSHQPIEYPAVTVTGSTHTAAAARFLEHLGSTEARLIFAKHGFGLPPPAPTSTTQPAR